MNNNTLFIISVISLPILLLLYWRLRLKKLAEYHSPLLGKIEVFEKYNKEKVLTINSYPEGVSIEDESIKKSYFYIIAQEVVKHCQKKKHPNILMLGLGANTISSLIARENPSIHQTIVEIDSQIIQACKDFFHFDDLKNVTLIHTDAFKLLDKKQAFNTQFDAIIVDIFIGTPTMIPHRSNQPEFIKQLIQYLKRDGVIIFNRPGNTQASKEGTFALEKYLSTLFKKVEVVYIEDPRLFKNHLITAYQKRR